MEGRQGKTLCLVCHACLPHDPPPGLPTLKSLTCVCAWAFRQGPPCPSRVSISGEGAPHSTYPHHLPSPPHQSPKDR